MCVFCCLSLSFAALHRRSSNLQVEGWLDQLLSLYSAAAPFVVMTLLTRLMNGEGEEGVAEARSRGPLQPERQVDDSDGEEQGGMRRWPWATTREEDSPRGRGNRKRQLGSYPPGIPDTPFAGAADVRPRPPICPGTP